MPYRIDAVVCRDAVIELWLRSYVGEHHRFKILFFLFRPFSRSATKSDRCDIGVEPFKNVEL